MPWETARSARLQRQSAPQCFARMVSSDRRCTHTPHSTFHTTKPRIYNYVILCNWLPPFYYLPLLFQAMNFGKTDSVTKSPSSAGCWAYVFSSTASSSVFSSTASSSVFSSSHLTIYCQFEKASLHLAGCLRLQPFTTLVGV